VHTIGLLALQGDYLKHGERFSKIGVSVVKVRKPSEVDHVDGLVFPGGESTTIGKLLVKSGLDKAISEKINAGMPVFATCAGLILLAKKIIGFDQFHLGLLDVDVERNAYGRQIESFETDFRSDTFGDPPIRGVFIRAPRIVRLGKGIEVLAEYEDVPVLIRQDNILAGSFHPELTDDLRIQRYFLSMF
jgi:5'-phosphate synthase pdxT subunit